MAGPVRSKKRTHQDFAAARSKSKTQAPRPRKKIRKQKEYHSDSSQDEGGLQQDENQKDDKFVPVDLLDSDEEGNLDDAIADDGVSSEDEDGGSGSSDEEEGVSARQKLKAKAAPATKSKTKGEDKNSKADSDGDDGGQDEDGEDDDDDDDDDEEEEGDQDDITSTTSTVARTKSKRNDPTLFATSLSKILSTKLSTTKRADPVLSRSSEAQSLSRARLDAALEAKARRHLRQQKLLALEKGRVRDILENQSVEKERNLRKTAQRGVKTLFNAVRAAQVRGAEADRLARKGGVVGVKHREEKVAELSREGFLDLIKKGKGGGGLRKGTVEEA